MHHHQHLRRGALPSPLHQAGFLHQSARKPSPLLGDWDYVLFSLMFPGPGRDISTRCVFI